MFPRFRHTAFCFVLTLLWFLSSTSFAAPLVPRVALEVKGKTLRPFSLANLVVQGGQDVPIAFVDDSLRVEVLQHLRARGYPAVGADDLVFGRDRAQEAELRLGGTISVVRCEPSGRGRDRCAIAINFSLLDLGTDRVVLQMRATYGEGELRGVTSLDIAQRLLRGAIDALLARPEFMAALAPKTSVPRTASLQFASLRTCSHVVGAMPADSKRALQATVLVEAGRSSGSGFFVSDDGYVLTAAHVVNGESMSILTKDGQRAAAELVRVDADADVALLRVPMQPEVCFDAGAGLPDPGSTLYALGAPLGDALSFSLTRGIVSGARRHGSVTVVQTDASVNPGNSGGPLVDEQGRAVGVVSFKLSHATIEGIAFGVLMSSALEALALTRGATTDTTLATTTGPIQASSTHAPVVLSDMLIDLRHTDTPLANDLNLVRRRTRILLFTGLGTMTAGLITLLAASDETAPGLVGFGVLCAGAGVTISAPIYRGVARRRARERHASLSLAPTGAALSLRF